MNSRKPVSIIGYLLVCLCSQDAQCEIDSFSVSMTADIHTTYIETDSEPTGLTIANSYNFYSVPIDSNFSISGMAYGDMIRNVKGNNLYNSTYGFTDFTEIITWDQSGTSSNITKVGFENGILCPGNLTTAGPDRIPEISIGIFENKEFHEGTVTYQLTKNFVLNCSYSAALATWNTNPSDDVTRGLIFNLGGASNIDFTTNANLYKDPNLVAGSEYFGTDPANQINVKVTDGGNTSVLTTDCNGKLVVELSLIPELNSEKTISIEFELNDPQSYPLFIQDSWYPETTWLIGPHFPVSFTLHPKPIGSSLTDYEYTQLNLSGFNSRLKSSWSNISGDVDGCQPINQLTFNTNPDSQDDILWFISSKIEEIGAMNCDEFFFSHLTNPTPDRNFVIIDDEEELLEFFEKIKLLPIADRSDFYFLQDLNVIDYFNDYSLPSVKRIEDLSNQTQHLVIGSSSYQDTYLLHEQFHLLSSDKSFHNNSIFCPDSIIRNTQPFGDEINSYGISLLGATGFWRD